MLHFLDEKTARRFSGKTCLVRIDLNLEGNGMGSGVVPRLSGVVPTIALLAKHGVKIILLSHRGRPDDYNKTLSLYPFLALLKKNLASFRAPLRFIPYNRSLKTIRGAIGKAAAPITLLENLRFWRGEESGSRSFARELARLGDFFVNDAFSVAHRPHASIALLPEFLPSFGGLLLRREVTRLNQVAASIVRPFTIIIGGAKISDKLGIIRRFQKKADYFLLGGGAANTFFAARGIPVGDSLVDWSVSQKLGSLVRSPKIALPLDLRIFQKQILDIGPLTIQHFEKTIRKSGTIVWSGPMGLFEQARYSRGTAGIWKAILRRRGSRTVIGGGDTVASLRLLGRTPKIPPNVFLSTGGGAMLAYLAGEKLPGLEALKKYER